MIKHNVVRVKSDAVDEGTIARDVSLLELVTGLLKCYLYCDDLNELLRSGRRVLQVIASFVHVLGKYELYRASSGFEYVNDLSVVTCEDLAVDELIACPSRCKIGIPHKLIFRRRIPAGHSTMHTTKVRVGTTGTTQNQLSKVPASYLLDLVFGHLIQAYCIRCYCSQCESIIVRLCNVGHAISGWWRERPQEEEAQESATRADGYDVR